MDFAFVAVHVGAGYHSEKKRPEYEELCKKCCRMVMKMLKEKASATDAVTNAVAVLEDSPLTNAGIGSNLTNVGTVECDASIMDGKTLNFGSVGALKGIQNPVKVAKEILIEQTTGLLDLGRIPPCCLVGVGAQQWAVDRGFAVIENAVFISDAARQVHKKYERMLMHQEVARKKAKMEENKSISGLPKDPFLEEKLDTVGAICVDMEGNIASSVSSGGLALKHPGRLGQAAIYGCGCWAQNSTDDKQPGVAASVSGAGEFLIKTMFAKECCNSLHSIDDSINAVEDVFKNKFLGSPFLKYVEEKHAGALLVKYFPAELFCELLWAHTTNSMGIGYMSKYDKDPQVSFSQKPDARNGKSILIQGEKIKLKPS